MLNDYYQNIGMKGFIQRYMDVSKFYHGDYYLEELKTIEGK